MPFMFRVRSFFSPSSPRGHPSFLPSHTYALRNTLPPPPSPADLRFPGLQTLPAFIVTFFRRTLLDSRRRVSCLVPFLRSVESSLFARFTPRSETIAFFYVERLPFLFPRRIDPSATYSSPLWPASNLLRSFSCVRHFASPVFG